MQGRARQRYWRAGIGLLAVYALCLQTLLGLQFGLQSVLNGALSASADASVICTGHAEDQGGTNPAQPSHHAHCPLCTLAPLSHAMAPERAVATLYFRTKSKQLDFVSAVACVSFYQAKSTLSRGPPAAA